MRLRDGPASDRVWRSARHAAAARDLPCAGPSVRSGGGWRPTFMLLGIMASRSRTGLIMLAVIAIVYVIFRPHQMKRAWPALIPALAGHPLRRPRRDRDGVRLVLQDEPGRGAALPGRQRPAVDAGAGVAHGVRAEPDPRRGVRYADHDGRARAAATKCADPRRRLVGDPARDGCRRGAEPAWIYVRSIHLMGRAAWRDLGPRGSLLIATTAGVASYGVGMFTYDALGVHPGRVPLVHRARCRHGRDARTERGVGALCSPKHGARLRALDRPRSSDLAVGLDQTLARLRPGQTRRVGQCALP